MTVEVTVNDYGECAEAQCFFQTDLLPGVVATAIAVLTLPGIAAAAIVHAREALGLAKAVLFVAAGIVLPLLPVVWEWVIVDPLHD